MEYIGSLLHRLRRRRGSDGVIPVRLSAYAMRPVSARNWNINLAYARFDCAFDEIILALPH